MRPEASQVGQNQRPRGTLNNEGTKQSIWYPKSQPSQRSRTSDRSPQPQVSQRIVSWCSSASAGFSSLAFCSHFSLAISCPPTRLKIIINLKTPLSIGQVLICFDHSTRHSLQNQ